MRLTREIPDGVEANPLIGHALFAVEEGGTNGDTVTSI